MSSHKEEHRRSIIKAVSYRLLASTATTTIVFIFTRKIALSIGAGLAEAVVKMLCYYIHERAWSLIKYGKKPHPLSSLPVERELEENDMGIIKDKLIELGYLSKD